MTVATANPGPPASPMHGPDFVMGRVATWSPQLGGLSQLTLDDGSQWQLATTRSDYAAQVSFIELAQRRQGEVLVSGSRSSGLVERIAAARRLAVQSVGAADADGRRPVLFHGPPSIYRLRMNRPDSAQALALLEASAASGAFLDTPDLLVGIDTVTREIVQVRGLRAAAPPRR